MKRAFEPGLGLRAKWLTRRIRTLRQWSASPAKLPMPMLLRCSWSTVTYCDLHRL